MWEERALGSPPVLDTTGVEVLQTATLELGEAQLM
jgi:hypothetical protein